MIDVVVIRRDHLEKIEFHTNGFYAKAWRAECKGSAVCIKVFNVKRESNKKAVRVSISSSHVLILQASKLLALQSELTVLLICQHENILRLSGLLLDEAVLQGFGLVTEFADHDTLDEFLYEGSEFVASYF